MPSWVLPTVVTVAALVVVMYSAVQTGWWRAMTGAGNSGAVITETDTSTPEGATEPAARVDETTDVAVAGGAAGAAADERPGATAQGARETRVIEPAVERAVETTVAPVEAPVVEETAPRSTDTEPVRTELGAEETAGEPAPEPTISGPGGPYRVVALSSRGAGAAAGIVTELAGHGYVAEVLPVEIGDGDVWYRVAVVGGYPALDEARGVASELKALGYRRAWVHKE
jgi:hypothetical protein